jgi:hypothetical protein
MTSKRRTLFDLANMFPAPLMKCVECHSYFISDAAKHMLYVIGFMLGISHALFLLLIGRNPDSNQYGSDWTNRLHLGRRITIFRKYRRQESARRHHDR